MAIDTVKGMNGCWNWALFGAVTMPVQPAQSSPAKPSAANVAAKKEADDQAAKEEERAAAEKAAAEKKASEEKQEEAAKRAAEGKAATDKAAKEKEEADAEAAKKAAAAVEAAAKKAAADKAGADKAEKAAAEKAAADKAAFDAAVEKAANAKLEEQRKSMIAEAQAAAIEAAKAEIASEVKRRESFSGEVFSRPAETETEPAGDGKDQFTLQKPCPESHLGAFDCVATEESKQLGWFSSSMPPDEVLVVQVESDSWADKVGLKTGDELMEVQGNDVSSIDQKAFVEFMHKRPLTLSFFRQEGARDKMLQRGSLPATGRGSTPLRPSLVNRLNAKEDVRVSFVERQNNAVNSSTPSRTSRVLQAMPQWEDFTGELHIRSGWAWKRRFFQLAQGHLRWWKQKEMFDQTPRPAAEVDICLVQAAARWKVEQLKGSRFELNYHAVDKIPPRTMDVPKAEEPPPEVPKERQSFLQRFSNRASSLGARVRSSSVVGGGGSSKREASQEAPRSGLVTQYLIAADDMTSATEWARAIWHHVAYVDMLSLWPMPLEGRQGDIKFYGIEVPDS